MSDRAATETALRSLLDSLPEIAWLKDREGRFLEVNEPFLQSCGVNRDILIGKTDFDIWPEDLARGYVHDDQLVMATGKVRRVEEQLAGLLAEGRTWIETIKVPLYDSRGDIAGTAGVARDVTERRRLERELAEARDHFFTLVNAVPEAVFATDFRGRWVQVNEAAAALVGQPPTITLGKTADQLFGPAVAERLQVIDDRVRGIGGAVNDDLELADDSGRTRWWAVRATLHVDPRGRSLVVWVVRDITDRRQAEEALRELNRRLEASNRDLEAFGHTVSHDLQTPLRAIRGFGGALLEEYGAQLGEVATDYLERVLRAGERMERLIDDLLMVSRASGTVMTSCPVDLARYAREAAAQLCLLEPGRQLELRVAERIEASGDPTLLRLCVDNLLGNAFKFSRIRQPARIEVGTLGESRPGGAEAGVVYFVRDNGVGFDMRHAERVFQLFERLHRADEYGGSGVGLAIVHRIVERHGGRVWVESQPDHGTTVYFTLDG